MFRSELRRTLPGYALTLLLVVCIQSGFFATAGGLRLIAQLCLLVCSVCYLSLRFASLWQENTAPTVLRECEAGALFFSTAYGTIALSGGLSGPLQYLPFLLTAIVGASVQLLSAACLCVVACLLDVSLFASSSGSWLLRGAFLLLFGGSYNVLLGAEMARIRSRAAGELRKLRRQFREDAQEFRLLDSVRPESSRDRQAHEELQLRASVDSVRQTLFFTLNLLKKSLGLHSCGLLWLSTDEKTLSIKEIASDAEPNAGPFSAVEGIWGSMVRRKETISYRRTREADDTLSYYMHHVSARVFFGVPVMEGKHLRGILFADRLDDRPFGEAEAEALLEASEELMRSILFERAFIEVEKERERQSRFFQASQQLLAALSVEDVLSRALDTTKTLIDYDFAAICLYQETEKTHTLALVRGQEEAALQGYTFADNRGLASMVVKNGHYLPAFGEPSQNHLQVFDAKAKLRSYDSLLLLPLLRPKRGEDSAERRAVLGSLILASKKRGVFHTERRQMLTVVASQIAQSLENAMLYDHAQRQATTDGLTGLLNRRHFLATLEDALARAERHKRPLSLIISDVDHFKKVNDTYGHPVGDEVLRGVSKTFRDTIRKIDHAGRYGGEEFVLVLEGTDMDGAKQMAERIREGIKGLQFASEKGLFRVTASLGIATYPHDGVSKELLIEHADQALYLAKHSGRDQSRLFSEVFRKKAAS